MFMSSSVSRSACEGKHPGFLGFLFSLRKIVLKMPQKKSSEQRNLPEHYSGKYKGSFAYITIKDRFPVILVKVDEYLRQSRQSIAAKYGENANEEVKEIIGRLSELQNEMLFNKRIKPLICESLDTSFWNEYLVKQQQLYGFPPAWYDSPWLLVECYFYRRMKQAFELSPSLKEFDPFQQQKETSFLCAMDAVVFMCSALNKTLDEIKHVNDKSDLLPFFRRYLEVSLWGNKWDLSISAGSDENMKQNNPLNQLEELRERILVNNTTSIFKVLLDAQSSSKQCQIDFVLDNAGFELFGDLCFLYFLHEAKLVSRSRLHVKMMPWFVSDTLQHDINWLLETLSQSKFKNMVSLGKSFSRKLKSGEWILVKEIFWTLPHDYSEMRETDPFLYKKLGESDLVIFKGDLNYRKLTGARMWNETTSFEQSLNGFLPTNVATLRTIKADVVVGLEAGTTKMMEEEDSNWKFSGNYALIQCVTNSS